MKKIFIMYLLASLTIINGAFAEEWLVNPNNRGERILGWKSSNTEFKDCQKQIRQIGAWQTEDAAIKCPRSPLNGPPRAIIGTIINIDKETNNLTIKDENGTIKLFFPDAGKLESDRKVKAVVPMDGRISEIEYLK